MNEPKSANAMSKKDGEPRRRLRYRSRCQGLRNLSPCLDSNAGLRHEPEPRLGR
jgi:succinate dehydrogenase flavin-adding protein (antitoxin of CptAB toxin-antitoxin module)